MPGVEVAMQATIEAATWGYGAGLAFVVFVLLARRSGGR